MMNKKLKTINIRGKKYVEVKERILYLANEIKDYSIETEYEYFEERKMWVVKAILKLKGNLYTGLAQEVESSNPKQVNFASALENAETSAVGRACAMAGIGVIDSIASVDEITKARNRGSSFNTQKDDLVKKTVKQTGCLIPSEEDQKEMGIQAPNKICNQCGADMAISKSTGKEYCSAKCWLK